MVPDKHGQHRGRGYASHHVNDADNLPAHLLLSAPTLEPHIRCSPRTALYCLAVSHRHRRLRIAANPSDSSMLRVEIVQSYGAVDLYVHDSRF